MTKLKDQLNDLVKDLGYQIRTLAVNEYADFQAAALKDGKAFLKSVQRDIALWTAQAALKELTQDELAYLIKGKADVTQLHALTKAGLTKVRAQRFREAVIDIIVGGIFKAAGKVV